jgi:plastocyanin
MRLSLLATALSLVSTAPSAQPAAATGAITGHVDAVDNGKQVTPIGGVYVWLVDTNRAHKRDPSVKLPHQRILQLSRAFDPNVLVVPKGTEVDFPNQTKTDVHNVFSPDPYFDLDRYGPGTSKSHKFDVAGPEVEIYCDIHKCMWAHIKVVDVLKPTYIQQVSLKGEYRFDHLDPGTYKVYAWAVASKEISSGELAVSDKPVKAPDLHVQLGTLNLQHNNKLGSTYDKIYDGCR